MRKKSLQVISELDELTARLRSGDSAAITLAREMLTDLIAVSRPPQLAMFLKVVEVCAVQSSIGSARKEGE